MIRAAIFDMDGLLVDSEPLWKEVEREVYGGAGVPVTPERAARTKGLGLHEVAEYWRRVHAYDEDPEELVRDVVLGMIGRMRSAAELMPGAREALAFVRGRVSRVALASSSPRSVIDTALERFALADAFDAVLTAADEEHGKPHPAIYLSAARTLGVSPLDAVAIEDSLNGVISARAARMRCVAVPAAEDRAEPGFGAATLVLPSLAALDGTAWRRLGD